MAKSCVLIASYAVEHFLPLLSMKNWEACNNGSSPAPCDALQVLSLSLAPKLALEC